MVTVNYTQDSPCGEELRQNYHDQAVRFEVTDACLYLYDPNDNVVAVYSWGSWHSAEVAEDE
jgi:hypothetical protein